MMKAKALLVSVILSGSALAAYGFEKTQLFFYAQNEVHGGSAIARETGHVDASGNSTVQAYDQAVVRVYDTSSAEGYGHAVLYANAQSKVKCLDNTRVFAINSSEIDAAGS